jgi:predicted exporter
MDSFINKDKQVWVLAGLLILLGITTGGWVKASTELSRLSKVDSQFSQDSLAVCDDLSSPDNQSLCVKRLVDLSQTLQKYEAKLKTIRVQN